jgi:hypothetical protein
LNLACEEQQIQINDLKKQLQEANDFKQKKEAFEKRIASLEGLKTKSQDTSKK